MFDGPIRGGTRGGQAEFKWTDVSADKDREHYLGHSINAPTGRWQKNKDVHWYNRDLEQSELQRQEELKKVKEAEAEALAIALGFKPAPKPGEGPSANPNDIPLGTREKAGGETKELEDTEAIAKAKEEKRKAKEEKRKKKEEKRMKKEMKKLKKLEDRGRSDSRSDRYRSRSRSPRSERHRSRTMRSRSPEARHGSRHARSPRPPEHYRGREQSRSPLRRRRSPTPTRDELEGYDRRRWRHDEEHRHRRW
ncbi:hypothetical protein M422DRAFT_41104 [Sphaerobolus stellatus SS14]|nr:hypothetical protein M422DRAFT_41104 [Sphaerobolus stellatus SS14]